MRFGIRRLLWPLTTSSPEAAVPRPAAGCSDHVRQNPVTPRITFAVLSDRGRTHPDNEDRWLADPDSGIFAIADGMAHAEPAQLAVDQLRDVLPPALASLTDLAAPEAAGTVQDGLQIISARVREAGFASGDVPQGWGGLGAVLALAVVRGAKALVAHLGDCRVYLMRVSEFRRRTRDHSLLQQMIDAGRIDPAHVANCRYNGGPSRYLGMEGEVEADVQLLALRPGDRLLLCSDGLCGMLHDDVLHSILRGEPDPGRACQRLIEAANEAGGEDNITALVLDVAF